MNSDRPRFNAPPIPDHELLGRIAVGSYGSIWLARNVLGSHRAVKIVRRSTFKSERQYEREFEGVRRFEPISRSHPGFVHILHVGRNDEEGHFYYIMELADDARRGQRIEPANYSPRTLRSELDRRRRLCLEECVVLSQTLLLALEELHSRNLVHRDIKPANLIYVDGVPKLADIGTVATTGHKDTPVGSLGYNPPEGSGQVTGDVFSFGRVLYEMFSGVAVQELHDALPDLRPRLKEDRERRFYDVIRQGCHPDPCQRLASARELREALSRLLPINDSSPGQSDEVGETATRAPQADVSPLDPEALTRETHNGPASPDSPVYVRRAADAALESAMACRAGLVVVSGAPQTGKTSLLARALQQARGMGARVAFTDLQKFSPANFQSLEAFYRALGDSLADQLDLPIHLARVWDPRRSPNTNFDRYLRREALGGDFEPIVWGLDELVRLQDCGSRGEFCRLLRAWRNERALDPGGPLARLTLILTWSGDIHQFAADGCQAVVSFGEHVTLDDFSVEELAELNRRCGSPLRSRDELQCFHQLVGGRPFLSRYGLLQLVRQRLPGGRSLLEQEGWPTVVFAEPMQLMSARLANDASLTSAVRQALNTPAQLDSLAFHQLRNAGFVVGDTPASARIPCELYALHLRQHLNTNGNPQRS